MLSHDPVLPEWFVLPLALFAAAVAGLHLMLLQEADVPSSRRRIRTASGLITLLVIPLVAYLFGIVSPAERRAFLLASGATVGLLFIIVLLAGVDIVDSLRLVAAERRAHRERLRSLRVELRRIVSDARPPRPLPGAGRGASADLPFRPDAPGDDRSS